MLEHVAANQTRFVAPGLSPDTRGVALGRFVVVLLPSIDRVVGLFRGLSEKTSLDELLPALRVAHVRTPLQSREFVVQLPVGSSYNADSIAAVAHLVGGLTFTGSAKHFVKYRDTRSPLGYDVDTLHGGGGDFVLYAGDFVQVYEEERQLDFARLAQTLSLQDARGDELLEGEVALLRVVRGLWRPALGYLHRSGVRCSAAAAEVPRPASGDFERFFLIRCETLPERMATLFHQTPGVEVYRLKTPSVAVQLGYRHPFELSSCASIFDSEHFYLYCGDRDRIEQLEQQPHFVGAATLVELGPLATSRQEDVAVPARADEVRIPLRLVPVTGAQPRLVASRIPLGEAERLKRLIYLLPPPVLAGYGICVTADYVYLYSESGIDFVPLGEMFWSLAPGVMVPQGYNLLPRVAAEVLREHLGAHTDQLFFFCAGAVSESSPRAGGASESSTPGAVSESSPRAGGASESSTPGAVSESSTPGAVSESSTPGAAWHPHPELLRFERGDFTPLGRFSLAEVRVRKQTVETLPAASDPAALTLVNDDVGVFPLWAFDGELPAALVASRSAPAAQSGASERDADGTEPGSGAR